MRPNIQYFQIMHVVIVSVILLDLLPSFICIQSLHSVCSWLYCPSGKDGESDKQSDRQRFEGLTA